MRSWAGARRRRKCGRCWARCEALPHGGLKAARGQIVSYVYMLALESSPRRYERGMRLLTLGRLARVREVVVKALRPGQRVLEIGSGTGELAVAMAEQGADVTGIDISPAMLEMARELAGRSAFPERVRSLECSAMELDHAFQNASFDVVVSVLTFSQMLPQEIDFVLTQCRRLLAPNGRLIVADEVWPASPARRVVWWLVRLPFAAAAYVVTQTSSQPLRGVDQRFQRTGFSLEESQGFLAGTLMVYVASVSREVVRA